MVLTTNILANIFADSALFCGREDVIHGIIYHHLIASGLSPTQVAREQPLASPKMDIVVFPQVINGEFYKTSQAPLLVIEVKGGAYGYRNALAEELSLDGYCADIGRLSAEEKNGTECWFLCVDMPELGRAVDSALIKNISDQCGKHKVCFAYYCQGEQTYHYSTPRQPLQSLTLKAISPTKGTYSFTSIFSKSDKAFGEFVTSVLSVKGHEANLCALLYSLLRNRGFGANQISMETYFSFAKREGTRMHDRPDLVIFDSDFDGRFNLYSKGDMSRSNDAHKLRHIKAIVEAKGSASLGQKSEKARVASYMEDLKKLSRWRGNAANSSSRIFDGIFLCADYGKKPLSDTALSDLKDHADGNKLVVIGNEMMEISSG